MLQLAYGTGSAWLKQSEHGIDRPIVEAVKTAIGLGYRHLDGAQRRCIYIVWNIHPYFWPRAANTHL